MDKSFSGIPQTSFKSVWEGKWCSSYRKQYHLNLPPFYFLLFYLLLRGTRNQTTGTRMSTMPEMAGKTSCATGSFSLSPAMLLHTPRTSTKKLFYGGLTKRETNAGPMQKNWITHFMNQISTTALCFVWKVMCIYGPIFQQDKYDMRQVFPK